MNAAAAERPCVKVSKSDDEYVYYNRDVGTNTRTCTHARAGSNARPVVANNNISRVVAKGSSRRCR